MTRNGVLYQTERTTTPDTPDTGEWGTYFTATGRKIIDDAGVVTSANDTIIPGTVHARLSLSSSDPAPVSDQTAATTLYLLPYGGEHIALHDGSSWSYFALGASGINISIPATTDTNYDVFVYDSSGLTLELVAWTNDTTRATAITAQDGAYVKSGDTTRLYVGTIRTTDSSGQCEDSLAKRFVWNYYNRLPRTMRVIESTDSWAYTTATYRAMNNSTANRIAFVNGVQEEHVEALAVAIMSTSNVGGGFVGIGLDSTSANSAHLGFVIPTQITSFAANGRSTYRGDPGLGYHYLQALEKGNTGMTFYGDAGTPSDHQAGIQGVINA